MWQYCAIEHKFLWAQVYAFNVKLSLKVTVYDYWSFIEKTSMKQSIKHEVC